MMSIYEIIAFVGLGGLIFGFTLGVAFTLWQEHKGD